MDDRFLRAAKALQGRTITSNDLVVGQGNGVSDSVPAAITTRTGTPVAPAALSVGEFVIKADTVSKLGGGATDPGVEFFKRFTVEVDKMDRFVAADFANIVIDLAVRFNSDYTPGETEVEIEMEEAEDATEEEDDD